MKNKYGLFKYGIMVLGFLASVEHFFQKLYEWTGGGGQYM